MTAKMALSTFAVLIMLAMTTPTDLTMKCAPAVDVPMPVSTEDATLATATAPAQFSPPHSDQGLDLDADGLYDYLDVKVSVNVSVSGNYTVRPIDFVNPYYDTDCKGRHLEVGVHVVELRFVGCWFNANAIDGPYAIWLFLEGDYSIYGGHNTLDMDWYNTSVYSHDEFAPRGASLALSWGQIESYGLDTDGDTLYDYVVVTVYVNVAIAGVYNLTGSLSFWQSYAGYVPAHSTAYLEVGEGQAVELWFTGWVIGSRHSITRYVVLGLWGTLGEMLDSAQLAIHGYWWPEFPVPPETNPPVTSARLAGNGAGKWWSTNVTVELVPDDGRGSGTNYTMYRIDDDAWTHYTENFTVSGIGNHTVEFYSVDFDSNEEAVVSIDINIETTQPTTTHALAGTLGENGWYRTPVSVALTAVDEGWSGINTTWYRVNGGLWQTYGGEISLAADGASNVDYYSIDNAQNAETMKTAIVKIDAAAPTTTHVLSGTGNGEWWSTDVAVYLTSDDGAGCGTNYTMYRIDDGAWTLYAEEFAVTGIGSHTVEFYSVDLTGNEEAAVSTDIKIENVAPTTTYGIAGTQSLSGWYTTAVAVTLQSSDAHSGVRWTKCRVDNGLWIEYSAPVQVATEGTHQIEFFSEDIAGNEETVDSIIVKVDVHAPVPNLIYPAEGAQLDTSEVTVSWTCTDQCSGIECFQYSVDGGVFVSCGRNTSMTVNDLTEGPHNITVRATDEAGNFAEKTVAFNVTLKEGSSMTTFVIAGAGAVVVIIAAVCIFVALRWKSPPSSRT